MTCDTNVIHLPLHRRRPPQGPVRVQWVAERIAGTALIFGVGLVTIEDQPVGGVIIVKALLGEANVRRDMAARSPMHALLANSVLDLADYDLSFIVWLGRELGLDAPTDPVFLIGFKLDVDALAQVLRDTLATFGDAQSPLIAAAGSRAAASLPAKRWKDVCVLACPR